METADHRTLYDLAEDQMGYLTTAQAARVGVQAMTLVMMERRGRLERVSRGVYRLVDFPAHPYAQYMQATLWPYEHPGVLSHETALSLYALSDVAPAKVHITVPAKFRIQRKIPDYLVVHRADLAPDEIGRFEGMPITTPERTIQDCAHLGPALLAQAIVTSRRTRMPGPRAALRPKPGATGRAPQAVVIAGPNGAGKSSSAPDLLRDTIGIDTFVNADVIAQGLAGFRPESAAFEAGRVMLRRLTELARGRADFAFESTLAGRSALPFLRRLIHLGFHVHIIYLWLPSPDLAVARVRTRVAAGGHDVPEPVVRRRYSKSLVNFYRLYRPATATWRLYNGGILDGSAIIAHGLGPGAPVVVDAGSWSEVRGSVKEAE